MLNLQEVRDKIVELVLEVGKLQLMNLGKENLRIDTKSTSIDLVTEVDKKSEAAIIDFIRGHYPGHDILAEESGLSADRAAYRWIVDPLDGTTNYAQGLPVFAVSIALQYQGDTVLGVVYAPVIGQLFTAIKGQGAYLNGAKLRVAEKSELAECVLGTGFPYDIATHPANNVDYFAGLIVQARGIRRMGAAAYDLACVAAGKLDGFWEMKLAIWDVAAAVLLVEEAGGQVSFFRDDRGVSLIAGNACICRRIQEEINRIDVQK